MVNTLRLPGAWATCCRYRDGWAGAYMQGTTLKVLVNGAMSSVRFIGPARWLQLTELGDVLVLLYTMEVGGRDRAAELEVTPGTMGDPVDLGPSLGQPAAVWGPPGTPFAAVRYICIPGASRGEPARLLRWPRGASKPAPEDIPIAGGTTQGILQVYADGSVVFNQLAVNITVGGVTVERPMTAAGGVAIGQSLDDVEGVVLVRDSEARVARAFERPDGTPDGRPGRYPQIAALTGDRHILCSTQLGDEVVFRVVPPWPVETASPQPAPSPETAAAPQVRVKAWPRKMLVSTYWSICTKYQDATDLIGNALTIVDDETDIDAFERDLRRAAQLVPPGGDPERWPLLIGTARRPVPPEVMGLAVGWVAGSADLDDLGRAVETLRATRPRKLISAYLDRSGWPATPLPWWGPDVLPNLQVYRLAIKSGGTWVAESADAFQARILADLRAVTKWAPYIGVSLRFDDYNLKLGPDVAVEDAPFYARVIREFPVALVHLFADRRPGGMSTHPALRELAHGFADAVPLRPHRGDYWSAPGDSPWVSLLGKLGQSVDMVQLSPDEKRRVLALIEAQRKLDEQRTK